MSDTFGHYCPTCERPKVRRHEQEPYNDGKWFISVSCMACGYGKIIRDDLCPDQQGYERPPRKGGRGLP